MMKLPLLIFTLGASLVEASVKARPSRNRDTIMGDRSRKTRETKGGCYNDRDCCFFGDCCNMNLCVDYCYEDRQCCDFNDCCDLSRCYDVCYTDSLCCDYQDCCNPDQCSDICYADDVCCEYQDCCDPYSCIENDPPEQEEEEDNDGVNVDADLCFSEAASVQVKGKGSVFMKDLLVGDFVLTGSNKYEVVYAFGHRDPFKETNFLQLGTMDGKVLELTTNHMVFTIDKHSAVRAGSIQVGDVLKGENIQEIVKIGKTTRQGVYAPLTASGTVLVDGIVASSYIALQKETGEYVAFQNGIKLPLSQQSLAHLGLSPYRIYCTGLTSGFCTSDETMPKYITKGLALAAWVDEQTTVIQASVFMMFLLLTGLCFGLESLISPSNVAVAFLMLAVIMILRNKSLSSSGMVPKSVKTKTL